MSSDACDIEYSMTKLICHEQRETVSTLTHLFVPLCEPGETPSHSVCTKSILSSVKHYWDNEGHVSIIMGMGYIHAE